MRIAVLDIGGTSIKSGIWNGNALEEQREWDTRAKFGGAYLMERVKEILHTYAPFEAVGISTAGQVDTVRGSIYYANDNIPGYTGRRVREILEREFRVPAAVENDVNAAALGELHFGAGRGCPFFLCLTYGTGVGGAIVLEGNIVSGSTFSAGSFGGIVLHPEALRPGEEFSGCYEKYASVTALVREAEKIDASLNNGRKIFGAFEVPEVRACIDRWIDEIVYGLISLVHIFNPPLILLGGGILAQTYIVDEVRRRIKGAVSSGFSGFEVRRTRLGNQAGLMGAAWLAQRSLTD